VFETSPLNQLITKGGEKMKKNIFLYFTALAMIALFAGFAGAQQKFVAALNSMQMVPPNNSTAQAFCSVTYLLTPREELQFHCEFSGLSGGITQFGIHSAPIGQGGGSNIFTFYISGPTSGTIDAAVYNRPFESILRAKQIYLDLHSVNYPNGELRGQVKPFMLDSDVDGDARTDAFLFRPTDKYSYTLGSVNNAMIARKFDKYPTDSDPFLADFDGDGIADHSFIRTDSVNGTITTVYIESKNNVVREIQWGNANLGDQTVYGDYDRDGRMDVAVFRKTDGVWYILQSSDNQPRYEYWGLPNIDRACPGDYDKDGKTDLCVVRPENGQLAWYIRRSSDYVFYRTVWGLPTDTVLPNYPADVDGDGADDILIARNVSGQRYFYALRSSDNGWFVMPWGLPDDGLRIGDFDGDGKTDFAALRAYGNQLVWFINQSSNGQMRAFYWGLKEDK
jgi:hypothetical protein